MTTAGQLTIRVALRQGYLTELSVELRRPAATQLFLGQSAQSVLKRVPHLYSLCAHAQTAAAQAALSAATDGPMDAVNHRDLWVELLHENLWRLLLDWPLALDLVPAKEAFIAWRLQRHGASCADLTQELVQGPLAALAGQCLSRMRQRGDDVAPQPIRLAPQEWLDFWRGTSQTMPQLLRPASIRCAFLGRMAQTQDAALALASQRPFPLAHVGQQGAGVAQTLTARGVLTHAVHLVNGWVQDYRVCAPTDDYFANPDALCALLGERQYASALDARHALGQAVLALDPCLPYVLELLDA